MQCSLEAQDQWGNTPLHVAARWGNGHVCALMLTSLLFRDDDIEDHHCAVSSALAVRNVAGCTAEQAARRCVSSVCPMIFDACPCPGAGAPAQSEIESSERGSPCSKAILKFEMELLLLWDEVDQLDLQGKLRAGEGELDREEYEEAVGKWLLKFTRRDTGYSREVAQAICEAGQEAAADETTFDFKALNYRLFRNIMQIKQRDWIGKRREIHGVVRKFERERAEADLNHRRFIDALKATLEDLDWDEQDDDGGLADPGDISFTRQSWGID
mmetsp:Transcript_48212/g.102952  ORF Transcript_48212/g.102952 Transcript_48212/m.102952 type:complete len:271 (+) Transcript_48212:1-813(+)